MRRRLALALAAVVLWGCGPTRPATNATATFDPKSYDLSAEPLTTPVTAGGNGEDDKRFYGPDRDERDEGYVDGDDEGYGYDFSDDPLDSGGFGPNDAVIRVRPGPTARPTARHQGVRAGEWDDNANYREFLSYLEMQRDLRHSALNVKKRRFLVVRDVHGRPLPNCRLRLYDDRDNERSLTTRADGRALLFPRAEGFAGKQIRLATSCLGEEVDVLFDLAEQDGVVDLQLNAARLLPQTPTLDVAFVVDTTGSMSEEIEALRDTIVEVAGLLQSEGVHLRLGLVEYRDRGDAFLTRMTQMTTDAEGFAARVARLSANGGGDTPEDVNEGLRVAIEDLRWRTTSLGRLVFLIGDAPPQLDYRQSTSYADTVRRAAEQGIRIHTIAASGMDDRGQLAWRQIAQYTDGQNMFVLRGGAGPQSTGAGDPTSSCGGTHDNYTSGNLAALITSKVQRELVALHADPLRIAGFGRDEKAKPCEQRIILSRADFD